MTPSHGWPLKHSSTLNNEMPLRIPFSTYPGVRAFLANVPIGSLLPLLYNMPTAVVRPL